MVESETTYKSRDRVLGEIRNEISKMINEGAYFHAKELAVTYRLISGGAQPGTSLVEAK